MDYIKKIFNDENNMYVSFPSTDDNVICKGGETLRERLDGLNGNVSSDGTFSSVEPALMDMPRLYFSEGTLPTTKTATMMKFDYYSKTAEYHGWVEIKCQGNSSMSYPKKNFTIKLYKDREKTKKLKIDFKGWGKQSKFVLKANWIDLTHARNDVSARIWADIVKSRSSYLNLPELLRTSPNQGAVDGFPVTVYGNGYYQGRYTLNIPKDKWMSNMDDSLDTHCILCGENYVSGCFRATANINGSDWTDELHDTVPASIKTRWNECISFVMNSSDEEFKANLHNYFDVDSLIDYLLYGIESCGFDAFGKNQIYFTYDGQKWIASMYDMDSTWGLWWNGSKFVATDYPRESFEDFNGSGRQGNLLYIRLQKLFVNEIKARYSELKQTIFTYPYLVNKFEEFVQICPLDIVKEDYASTTANGAYRSIPSTSANNIQQIRSYINARLTYVDSYINSLTPPVSSVPCTGITLSANDLVFEHSTTAQTLTATLTPTNTTDSVVWSVSPTGICTVNNGVVTPVTNGNCVITATCGTQSASCNVSVNIDVQDLSVTALSLDKDTINLSSYEGNTNLLNGVHCTENENGNIIFDSITLGAGVYEYKNIDDGAFRWLGITADNKERYEMGDNTNSLKFIITSGTSSCVFNAYKNNIETNTIDKLGLYKIENVVLTDNVLNFTKIGDGYFINGDISNIHESANDSYGYVDVDSTKKYVAKINSDSYLSSDFSYAGIKGDATFGKYIGTPIGANSNFYIRIKDNFVNSVLYFENVDKIYWSGKNTVGIENVHIVEAEITPITETPLVSSYGTDTLTATLTPSNATNQNVVWTVDNENVELVTDGLNCTVKGKAVGNSVVTCTSQDTTNGTISDSCNVTVSSTEGGGEIDVEPVYTLPQPTTFNGTSDYIDTGVQLFDTNKDFTIFIDFMNGEGNTDGNQNTILHCIEEQEPYYGLSIRPFREHVKVDYYGKANLDSIISNPIKLIITHTKNSNAIKLYSNDNVTGIELLGNLTYQSITQNIILGAYQDINGNKGRFWNGTINHCKVWFRKLSDDEINTLMEYDTSVSGKVFSIDSTCMNTTDNKLVDKVNNIEATLTGAPTVNNNQIVFTANDTFNFNISSLNLTNKDRTFRIKFTPTTLDTNNRCICIIGQEISWSTVTSMYFTDSKLLMQHGIGTNFSNNTVGSVNGNYSLSRMPDGELPSLNTEYEIVISEEYGTKKIRWFINGTLIQDGTNNILYNPLYLGNNEGASRFEGSYSLIEIYDVFCDTYDDFTNLM